MTQTQKKGTTKKMSKGKKVAIGGAIAALGAGAYYFLGPNGKAHQKKASTLFSKMKKEAQSEIKKAKAATVPLYNKAVDAISDNYAKKYKMHEKDIKAFAKKLKSEWKEVSDKTKKKLKSVKK